MKKSILLWLFMVAMLVPSLCLAQGGFSPFGSVSGTGTGTGDVSGVGDCASGACLDGTSDGGTYISLYDGTSAIMKVLAGVRSFTLSSGVATSEDLTITFGLNDNNITFTTSTGATRLNMNAFSISANGFVPDGADGAALGSVTAEFSDLFLADGAIIYGQVDQSNTLTSAATGWSANLLFTGNAGFAAKNGITGAGFIDLYEDSDNGTAYTRLIGLADQGAGGTLTVGTTFTNAKWCSYATATGLTCNENAPAAAVDWTADQGATNIHANNIPDLSGTYQTALTYPVTGVASPTSGNLVKWGASGNTLADSLKIGTFTDTKWCSYSTSGGFECTQTAPQAALTYPVTGVASPTAGYLTKWGVSGNAIVDGPKIGTLTDGKWCSYSTANGFQCTENAPAGGHDAVTLGATATDILGLSTQEIGFDVQTAAKVLAGPATGDPAAPTFRVLAATDIPDISASYLPKANPTATGTATSPTIAASGAVTVSPFSTAGAQFRTVAATITDASPVGTKAIGAANSFGIPTFASDGNAITVTDAVTLYIAGVPVDGGDNMVLTNVWGLYQAAGNAYIAGLLQAGSLGIGATGSITEETNTMTFDDGDGAAITLQEIRAKLTPGTLTNSKWCTSNGTTISCTEDAPAGAGDVTDVGDCAGGACLDGSADGGTYVRLYDGTSAYESITGGVRTFTFGSSTANSESLILTLGDNDNSISLTSGTAATALNLNAFTLSVNGITPDAANGAALGSTDLEWSDAYFADGAVIYGQADQSATLTSSASKWTANNFASGGTLDVTGQSTLGAWKFNASNDAPNAAGESNFDGTDKWTFFGANSEDFYFRVGSAGNTVLLGSNSGVTTIDTGTIELKASKFTSGAADGERYVNVDNSAAYKTTGPAEGDISCKADTDTCARYNGAAWVPFAITGANEFTGAQTFSGSGGLTSPPVTTAITPASAGASTLGTTALEWGNVYLHDAKRIYFQANQSASLLGGASLVTAEQGFTVAGALTANGAVTLGDAGDDVVVKLNTNAGDGTFSGFTITRTVKTGSAAEAFGQAMFINASGELEAADADVGSAAAMPAVCILVTAGEGASKQCVTHGTVTETDWNWTVGAILYVSAAPATTTGLTETRPATTGHFIQRVGVALSADTILVNPSLDVGTAP